MSQVHKTLKKYSPGARLERAIVGDKVFDATHPLGTALEKQADAKAAAKTAAKEGEAQANELRKRQMEELGRISDEENRRIKGMLYGGRYGTRGYRGAPMFRARPSNTAGVALRTASSVGGASPAGAAMQAGGARGGLSRGGFRPSHQ